MFGKKSGRQAMDMCSGPLTGKIIRFALPLMLSGILQLLYNAADIVVVGQFSGKEALAAVGATSALINLIVNLFMGLSVGASVAVAKAWGAKDPNKEDRSSKSYGWNKRVAEQVESAGATAKLRCQVGGGHCEAEWEHLVPDFMHFLWME